MTLKEKFFEVCELDQAVKIADDYAIDFAKWRDERIFESQKLKVQLKIYKKEKKL